MADKNCVANLDLCIVKSGDWRHDFLWESDGVPVDLTGFDARMQIVDTADSSVLFDLTITNGKIELTPAEGRISVLLGYAELRAVSRSDAIYELLLKNPDGWRLPLVRGPIVFHQPISEDVDA